MANTESIIHPNANPMRSALENLARWYAGRGVTKDGQRCLHTMGLPVMEDAFVALGWSQSHPFKDDVCTAPGCTQWATCWTESIGYCSEHYRPKES